MTGNTILRLPAVVERTGRGKATIYWDINQGTFPHPVKLGARAVGWPSNEVSALISARIAGKTDDEVRALVKELESKRCAEVA